MGDVTAAQPMRFCTQCGNAIEPANARFCARCGTAVMLVDASATQPVTATATPVAAISRPADSCGKCGTLQRKTKWRSAKAPLLVSVSGFALKAVAVLAIIVVGKSASWDAVMENQDVFRLLGDIGSILIFVGLGMWIFKKKKVWQCASCQYVDPDYVEAKYART